MYNPVPGMHLNVSFSAFMEMFPESMDGITLPGDMEIYVLRSTIEDIADGFSMLSTNGFKLTDLFHAWSVRNQYKWNTLYKTMGFEYDPIENYRRHETESTGTTQSGNNAENMSGNDTQSSTAFNSYSETETGKTDRTEGRTGNYADSGQTDRNLLAYGNIGTTTTQQMINEERAVAMFDLYSIIARDFVKHFMVSVY